MTKYDMDIHAMEPKSLWPKEWQAKWSDDTTVEVDEYLRHLDDEGCDRGMFLPTRALFMEGFYADIYNDWAPDFCAHSEGRLIPAELLNHPLGILPGHNEPIVALPENALELVFNTIRPVIVHSVTRLRYSTNFHVDHALAHVCDAMKFVAELGAVGETPTCNIAIMEAGTWWVDNFLSITQREKLIVPWSKLFFGVNVDDCALDTTNDIIGSDFPHYDQQDVGLRVDDEVFTNALKFLGEVEV